MSKVLITTAIFCFSDGTRAVRIQTTVLPIGFGYPNPRVYLTNVENYSELLRKI